MAFLLGNAYHDLGALEFAKARATFRFALNENEQRINQAVRSIRRGLPKLG